MNSRGNRKRKYGRSTEGSPAGGSNSSMAIQRSEQSSEASVSEFQATTNMETNTSDSEIEQVRRQTSPLTRSKHWKWYGPKDTQRLMHLVFTKSASLDDVAYHWAQQLEENEGHAVIYLMQFFVDVTGFPVYTVQTNDAREIVDYMETHNSDVIRKHDYIFKFDTSWYAQASAVIFDFIEELLKQTRLICYNKSNVFDRFVSLFKAMSLSKVRAVKHAGVVFALRFAVNCANCLKNVQRDLKDAQGTFLNSVENVDKIERWMRDIAGKRDALNERLVELYAIIRRSYACNDKYLTTMRAMCAVDIYSLLRAVPELFFCKLKCIPMLIELLSDQNKKVRASALKTFEKLFRYDKYKEYTRSSMGKILNALHEAMYDINLNVAASAIDVITNILKLYPNGIPNEMRRIIFCTVYHKSYVLGKAAGNFLAMYLRIHWGKGGDAAVIEKFVKFLHTSGRLDLIPTVVESVVEAMPELQSYQRIIITLANGDLEFKHAVTLLDVLRHTVSQIISGRSLQTRAGSRRGAMNKTELNNIRYNLIPNLMVLFERYRERECQQILIGIVQACFSTKIISASLREVVKKIFKIMHRDFFISNDRETLDMISKIYKHMNDDLNPLKSLATAEAECCILKVMETINCLMKNNNDNSIDLLEVTFLRLAILYQHFDLSERGFIWNTEFPEHLDVELDTILPHHIESGCYKLVWELRELLESDGNLSEMIEDIEKINVFKIQCVEYLQFCFSYWDQSMGVQAKVFWCVCDLLQKFHGELKELVKLNPELKSLYFDLDSEQRDCMLDFLKTRVLHTSVPDRFGCDYLGKFLNTALLNQNALPLETMTPVFSYYFSLYEKYNEFFDAVLDILRKVPNSLLENFILKVLLAEYNKLESKQNFASVEHFNLGKLAVRFSLYLSTFNRLFEVLYSGLESCVVHPDNLSFLRYLRYFVDPLKQANRARILEIARVALQEYKSNEHVVCFLKRAEAKYVPNRNVRALSEASGTPANISTVSESSN